MKPRTTATALLCALVLGIAPAASETPAKPAQLWSLPLAPGEGASWYFTQKLAAHEDGTALLALAAERKAGNDSKYRLVVVSVGANGAVLARTTPGEENSHGFEITLVPDRDGFALATVTEGEKVVLYRLARDGQVRAAQPLRFRRESAMSEIRGIAADGRGNLILHGGVGPGPFAPSIASVDARGRIVWQYTGPSPMPPGGIPAAIFRRDGGTEAMVVDREKPYWERRSATGALLMRRPIAHRHYNCRAFLDERRLVELFYNWDEPHAKDVPGKHWILALMGPDTRLQSGHVAFDLAERESANCRLAVNGAGWIAVSLHPGKIMVFDAALARRGEIDLSAMPKAEVAELAVDAKGSVLALVDTARPGEGRALTLLRFAPIAR